MAKTTQWVERSVYSALNAFTNDGGVASAESIIVDTAPLIESDIYDASYPPADIRKAIIDQEFRIIARICRSVGHPARGRYLLRNDLAHLNTLPTTISPDRVFEVIIDGITVVSIPRTHASEISSLRGDTDLLPKQPYHAIEGNIIYCTYDALQLLHYGTPSGSSNAHASTINARFADEFQMINLPDEFALPLIYFTAGQIVATSDSDSSQAAPFFSAGEAILTELGIANGNN